MRELAMRRAREEALGPSSSPAAYSQHLGTDHLASRGGPGGVVALLELDEVSDLPPPRYGSFGANGTAARVVITLEAAGAEGVELGRAGPFSTEHQTVGANLFKVNCNGARVVFPAQVHPARKSMEVRVLVQYSEDGHRHLDCVGASDPIPVSWRSTTTKYYRLKARSTRGATTGGIYLSHRLLDESEVSPERSPVRTSPNLGQQERWDPPNLIQPNLGENPFANLPVFDERFMAGSTPYVGGLGPQVPRPLEVPFMPGSPFLTPGRPPFELGPVSDIGGSYPRLPNAGLARTPSWYEGRQWNPPQQAPLLHPLHEVPRDYSFAERPIEAPFPHPRHYEPLHEVPREYSFVERPLEMPEMRYVEKTVEVPRVQVQEVVRHVPRVHVQEMLREVPRVVPQIVERAVEVPQVEYVDRVVEVPQVHVQERFVEVPEVHYQEVIRQVPRIEVQEVERFVPRPVVQTVERTVPVPEVQVVERLVDVPEVRYQEVVKQVPRPVLQEAIRPVPRIETQFVEKIVEVPSVQFVEKLVEVPQVQIQEVIVPVPKVEVREIIRNVPKYTTQFVERMVEVPAMQVQQRMAVSPQRQVSPLRTRGASPQAVPRSMSPMPLARLPSPLPIPFTGRLPSAANFPAPNMLQAPPLVPQVPPAMPGAILQAAKNTMPGSPLLDKRSISTSFVAPPAVAPIFAVSASPRAAPAVMATNGSFVAAPFAMPPVLAANGSSITSPPAVASVALASGSLTLSPPTLPPTPTLSPLPEKIFGSGFLSYGTIPASSSPNLVSRPLLSDNFLTPAVSSTAPVPMVSSAPSLVAVDRLQSATPLSPSLKTKWASFEIPTVLETSTVPKEVSSPTGDVVSSVQVGSPTGGVVSSVQVGSPTGGIVSSVQVSSPISGVVSGELPLPVVTPIKTDIVCELAPRPDVLASAPLAPAVDKNSPSNLGSFTASTGLPSSSLPSSPVLPVSTALPTRQRVRVPIHEASTVSSQRKQMSSRAATPTGQGASIRSQARADSPQPRSVSRGPSPSSLRSGNKPGQRPPFGNQRQITPNRRGR